MKVSTFAVKLWRWSSMLAFAAILTYTYTSFDQTVAVHFTPERRPDAFLERDALFYGCVAIFLLNNTLINLLANLFPRIPNGSLPVPNQSVWAAHRRQLNELAENWFYALMAAINTVMALALWVLSNLNKQLGNGDLSGFQWLLPACALLFAVVILSLPIRLMMKPDKED
jgi:hypothetical protein